MIILCGASSVGKSTLAEDWCRQHAEYHHIFEVARDIMKERSITRSDLESYLRSEKKEQFFEFQKQIFEDQNTRESDLEQKGFSFIADRGPDPLVFAEQCISHESSLKLAEVCAAKTCLQRYRSDKCVVVIVCPLDRIEDDSVRIVPTKEEQIQYTECLKRILQENNILYKYCDKTDCQERLEWLEQVIKTRD